jgi:26S proteasome regulatory subunit N11
MLMNLHKNPWTDALTLPDFHTTTATTEASLQKLVSLADGYQKRVKEETELTKEQLKTRYVGKVDPKKHIESVGQELIEDNIVGVVREMIDKEASAPRKGTGVGGGGYAGTNGFGRVNGKARQGNEMEVDGEGEES